jgi:hypothetical protein
MAENVPATVHAACTATPDLDDIFVPDNTVDDDGAFVWKKTLLLEQDAG